jgi:hypothetical protein
LRMEWWLPETGKSRAQLGMEKHWSMSTNIQLDGDKKF